TSDARHLLHGCAWGREGLEELLHRRVVPEGLAPMREEIDVPRAKNEAASELHRVLAELVLPMPALLGARPRGEVARLEEVERRRHLEACGAIRAALRIDEQREIDAGLFAKLSGVLPVAEADGGDARPGGLDLFFVLAQLRDVLTAEDSPIVP